MDQFAKNCTTEAVRIPLSKVNKCKKSETPEKVSMINRIFD